MTKLRLRLLLLAAVIAAAPVFAAVASAQATVVVEVRTSDGSPGEARVILTSESGGGRFECQTRGGTCTLSAVPGGRYAITAEPTDGHRAPIPRVLPIPPRGAARLSVTLR